MANKKISELSSAGALTGTESVEIVQGGANVKTTTQDIADLGAGGGGGAWGSITGTLSSQTDLQAALDDKLDALGTTVDGGTNYTLQSSDLALINAGANVIIEGDGTGTLTIPLNSSVAFPLNCFIGFRGFILVAATGGVTATPTNASLDCDPDFLFALEKTATNTWNVHNGAEAAGGGGASVDDTIADGETTNAPSQNAVYDALVATLSTKTANYILGTDSADLTNINAGKRILFMMNVASANTFTIPENATLAVPVGAEIEVLQYGAGQTQVVGSGATVIRSENSYNLIGARYASVGLTKIATNEWVMRGYVVE